MPPLSALLFDFDGLILDTETAEMRCWEEAFRDHGQVLPLDYWTSHVGKAADAILERPIDVLGRLLGRSFTTEEVEALAVVRRRRRSALFEGMTPQPGVVDLLEQAREAGIRLAVVSSSKHDWVDGHLERLGLATYFELTVCADDAARAKPHPDLYLLALERLGVPASEAVALEDSPNGARAALDAELFVVAVPNALTCGLDLSHASARRDSMAEITLDHLRAFLATRSPG